MCEQAAGRVAGEPADAALRWLAARSPGRQGSAQSPHRSGPLCALTSGRAEATAGHLLGTCFECAGRRGFHLGFQTSFREEEGGEKKIQLCKWLRTGRRALGLTPLLYEFSEQPGPGRFMGARHGYARSRRRSISKLIKAVMSTFLATLGAWVYYFTIKPDPGWGAGAPLPTPLLFPLLAPPLFPLSSSPSFSLCFVSLSRLPSTQ